MQGVLKGCHCEQASGKTNSASFILILFASDLYLLIHTIKNLLNKQVWVSVCSVAMDYFDTEENWTTSGVVRSFFHLISKQIGGFLFRMDRGDDDILGKCKSRWIYKDVDHVCVLRVDWVMTPPRGIHFLFLQLWLTTHISVASFSILLLHFSLKKSAIISA